jgi:hypothetical protein
MINKTESTQTRFTSTETPKKTHFPGWLVWVSFTIWGLVVFKSYLTRYASDIRLTVLLTMLSPSQYLSGDFSRVALGHAGNLTLGLCFVLACAGLGRYLLTRVLKSGALNLWEETTFSTALGLGVIANTIIVLTATGLLYKWPIMLLLLAGTGLGAFSLRESLSAPSRPAIFKPGFMDLLAITLLIAAMLFSLAAASSPETFYDALVYQLAVPNLYILKHGFADMPYNLYSDLFLLHGMLYSAGLLIRDEMIPKFINYSAGVLTAATILG